MTRREQMLDDFDKLAVAELNDGATVGRQEAAASATRRPVAHADAPRTASSAWDWVIGAGVLALVILAARR